MKYLIIPFLFICACSSEKSNSGLEMNYQPFSTSTIAVSFLSAPTDTVYLEALTLNNIPDKGQRSELVSVADKGYYYLKLINDRPNSAQLSINNESYNLIIFPDDTVHVEVKSNEKEIELNFSGRGAAINEYYKAKNIALGYGDMRVPINMHLSSSSTYTSIGQKSDSIVNNELEFLEGYSAENELPAWFVHHEKAEIKYLGLTFKTAIPSYNELFNVFQDDLPAQYFSFISEQDINNPDALSSRRYFSFLNDYFMRDLPVEEFKNLSGYARGEKINNHILPKSKSHLTGEVKELYQKHLFSGLIQRLSDTTLIDSLAAVYEVEDYKNMLSIIGTRAKNKIANLDLLKGDTIPNFYVVDQRDSLVSLRDYQDKVVYINFWATWCGPCIKNMPELNQMIHDYSGQDEIAFLNICIDSEKEKWATSVERYQLTGINVFAEGNWNDKLKGTFNIKGIPNYVLIEPGNILFENQTNKAPAIKNVIDKLLKANPV